MASAGAGGVGLLEENLYQLKKIPKPRPHGQVVCDFNSYEGRRVGGIRLKDAAVVDVFAPPCASASGCRSNLGIMAGS